MPKVKELLSKWYPKKDKLNEFLQNIKINGKGRVEIEGLDLSSCGLSGHLYIPSLFEKIQRLDCSNNQLTSLPKLPDGLETFHCPKNNKLISLPELPKTLKDLDCSGCPLADEAIQKIKSHLNYNLNWRIYWRI